MFLPLVFFLKLNPGCFYKPTRLFRRRSPSPSSTEPVNKHPKLDRQKNQTQQITSNKQQLNPWLNSNTLCLEKILWMCGKKSFTSLLRPCWPWMMPAGPSLPLPAAHPVAPDGPAARFHNALDYPAQPQIQKNVRAFF